MGVKCGWWQWGSLGAQHPLCSDPRIAPVNKHGIVSEKGFFSVYLDPRN